MIVRRVAFFLVMVMIAVGGMAFPIESHAARRTPPDIDQSVALVRQLADEAMNTLVPGKEEEPPSVEAFRTILNQFFHVRTIGKFVLGRHWRVATKAQRKEYLELFEEMIIATYQNRFAEYSGQTIDVQDGYRKGSRFTIVNSEIKTPGNPPAKVAWWVASLKPGLRIIDVVVEGVSLAQTQRSEFSSVIRSRGGRIEGLLERMREMVPPRP